MSPWKNMSEHDIKELQEINKEKTPETESTSDNQSSLEQKMTSDSDWVPSQKKKGHTRQQTTSNPIQSKTSYTKNDKL